MNEARKWYEKAASQKKPDARAMFRLGAMYRDGDGVAQDDSKMREWLEKASAAGSAAASFMLGQDYIQGEHGVAKDEEKAFFYMNKAFDQGAQYAALVLSDMYIRGEGVKADPAKGEELQKYFDNELYWQKRFLQLDLELLQD